MLDYSTLLLVLLPALARGANDWSTPCVQGTCAYEMGDGVNTAFGSIVLSGSADMISDITPAAGWQISGCSPTWAAGTHSVQITCNGTASQMAHCDHVMQNGGQHKIVRLPPHCGAAPFARVAQPMKRAKRGVAHNMVLDYDFRAIPASMGDVSFAIQASNVQAVAPPRKRGHARDVSPRFSLSGLNTFNKTDTVDGKQISFQKDVPLLSTSLDCGVGKASGDGTLSVDVDVDVEATVTFAATIAGKILPPKVTQLELTAQLSGNASGTFNVDANVEGTFDTFPITVFTVGLPGLSFPGILDLGPELSINAELSADLNVQANLQAGASWTFPDVSLVFPPSQGPSSATADSSGNSPLSLSAPPTGTLNFTMTASLIPRVAFGLDVLKGLAKAQVFVQVDLSSTLDVNADQTASGCATLDGAIDISAGATGAISPIFTQSLNYPIFSKQVQLLQKCFGNPQNATDTSTDDPSTDTDTDTDTSTDDPSTDTDTDTSTDDPSTDTDTDTDTSTDTSTDDPSTDTDTDTDTSTDTSTDDPSTDTDTSTDTSTDDPSTDTDTSTDDPSTDTDTSTDTSTDDPSTATDTSTDDPSTDTDTDTATDDPSTDTDTDTDTSTDTSTDTAAGPSATDSSTDSSPTDSSTDTTSPAPSGTASSGPVETGSTKSPASRMPCGPAPTGAPSVDGFRRRRGGSVDGSRRRRSGARSGSVDGFKRSDNTRHAAPAKRILGCVPSFTPTTGLTQFV